MDVLRRVKALRRRPEKLVEDSILTTDCGDLHLHHPAFYSKNNNKSKTNHQSILRAYELGPPPPPLPQPNAKTSLTPPQQQQQLLNLVAYEEDLRLHNNLDSSVLSKLSKPKKIRVSVRPARLVMGDLRMNMRRKVASNEVFRSNSFKFERGPEQMSLNSSQHRMMMMGRRQQKVGAHKGFVYSM